MTQLAMTTVNDTVARVLALSFGLVLVCEAFLYGAFPAGTDKTI